MGKRVRACQDIEVKGNPWMKQDLSQDQSWRAGGRTGAISIKGQTRSEDEIVVERGEPHQKAGLI